MNEGYLILNCTIDNVTQIELLARSIEYHDPDRSITVIINDRTVTDKLTHLNTIYVEDTDNVTLKYFQSLMASPYTKTIAILPDQILTNFNKNVWENLRSMNSIVLPKYRYSYNVSHIPPTNYYHSSLEEKTLGTSSIINAIFFNKEKKSDYVFGLGIILSSSYDRDVFIEYISNIKNSNMPALPKYLWPEWAMTFLSEILPFKFTKFDFMQCIDLSLQENNYVINNWASRPWTEFLSYWINDKGDVKIENFIQLGLLKYINMSWLSEENLKHLMKKFE